MKVIALFELGSVYGLDRGELLVTPLFRDDTFAPEDFGELDWAHCEAELSATDFNRLRAVQMALRALQ